MNNIGLFIAALMGWQRGKEWLAEVDERYIRNFRFAVIATIFGYTALCGYAAYHQWHAIPSIAWVVAVFLVGLGISLSWQGLAAIAALSAATKNLTPLRVIGYLALVLLIPTAMSEGLMLGKITEPAMLFALYAGGSALGIYALLTPTAKWFKRVVVASAFFLIGKALLGLYYDQSGTDAILAKIENAAALHKDRVTTKALTPIYNKTKNGIKLNEKEKKLLKRVSAEREKNSIPNRIMNAWQRKEIFFDIPEDMSTKNIRAKVRPVCGIEPGEYEVQLAGTQRIRASPDSGVSWQDLDLADWGRKDPSFADSEYITYGAYLNNVRVGEKIFIRRGECLLPRFNLSYEVEQWFQSKLYQVEPFTITFILKK